MQHTLIPAADRKRIHREYALRAIIVAIGVLSVAILAGAVSLFPSYLRAYQYNKSTSTSLKIMRASAVDQDLDKAKNELTHDSLLLARLADTTGEVKLSDIIETMSLVRQNVIINSMTLVLSDPKTIAIKIGGIAPTRDALLSFRVRLEQMLGGTKVDIPIDQLAKNTNLPFNLSFVRHLQ